MPHLFDIFLVFTMPALNPLTYQHVKMENISVRRKHDMLHADVIFLL